MYTDPVKFNPADTGDPEYSDEVYTVDEFRKYCEASSFIDYDGYGCPVKDSKSDPNIIINPSELENIPLDATHIVWYNR